MLTTLVALKASKWMRARSAASAGVAWRRRRFLGGGGENENWGAGSAVEVAGELPEGVHRSPIMKRLPKTS